MGIRRMTGGNPPRRFMTGLVPETTGNHARIKRLYGSLPKKSGRSFGSISVRHKGGRHKRLYRTIDWQREKRDIAARVVSIEYDPNRTANIALVQYQDGERRYILAPHGLRVGQEVQAGERAPATLGNALPLTKIPIGTVVHNIELIPGKGGQVARAAGSGATLAAKEGGMVHLKMPSGETRLIPVKSYATIGQLGNQDWKNLTFGSAGRKRRMGFRPSVRGVAMSPRHHPHGGGEGKSGIGMKSPKSPWGKKTLGKKTRRKHHPTDRFIIARRTR